MLYLHLKPIFKARNIEKPYSFLIKSGFNHHTATNLLHSNTRTFRLDHIEDLCRVLVCEPNDLLAWKPDKDIIYPSQNPLELLRPLIDDDTLQQALSDLLFKELKKATSSLLPFIQQEDGE